MPRRRPRSVQRHRRIQARKKQFLLEETSAQRIRHLKLRGRAFTRLQWDYYNELFYHRSQVADRVTDALTAAAKDDFLFECWQRVVAYRYGLQPLHVTGSLRDPSGGRFNIGDIDADRYPRFPALYIASDKATAMQEVLCSDADEQNAMEFALAKPNSMVNVSLSGRLDTYIDLNEPERLEEFVEAIRTAKVSPLLLKRAQALRVGLPKLIESIEELADNLLSKTWRFDPMQLDIPSPSQIFGQLVSKSKIGGILYPSKFSGKNCLAVFPQGFANTDSWVGLDDEPPAEGVIRKIDSDVWRNSQSELCGGLEL